MVLHTEGCLCWLQCNFYFTHQCTDLEELTYCISAFPLSAPLWNSRPSENNIGDFCLLYHPSQVWLVIVQRCRGRKYFVLKHFKRHSSSAEWAEQMQRGLKTRTQSRLCQRTKSSPCPWLSTLDQDRDMSYNALRASEHCEASSLSTGWVWLVLATTEVLSFGLGPEMFLVWRQGDGAHTPSLHSGEDCLQPWCDLLLVFYTF